MFILRNKINLSRQKIGLIFLIFGFLGFSSVFIIRGYKEYQKRVLSFDRIPLSQNISIVGKYPNRILIPEVKIDLQVSPSIVSGNNWDISDTGASYMVGSGVPGEVGNTVIYGHNKKILFGPITFLKKNAEIIIETNNRSFTYIVTATKIVNSNQVEVLEKTTQPFLTLYTCTGFLDSKRFVVFSKLKE